MFEVVREAKLCSMQILGAHVKRPLASASAIVDKGKPS